MVPNDVGGESAEADRWVAEALANARDWFPELSEAELREPLEHAFQLAGEVGRGEREFHEVFEAELRRAVEERDVLGAADSVLPGSVGGSPQAFPAFGAPAAEGLEEPLGELVEEAAEEPVEEAAEEPVEEVAEKVVAEPARSPEEEQRARAYVLAVGAQRLLEQRTPREIQEALGVDADYYAESMRWLLYQVDRTLEQMPPAHVDRERIVRLVAGIESAEERFATERHVRECEGCEAYLEALRRAAALAVERHDLEALERPQLGPVTPVPSVSYTADNAWSRGGRESAQRLDREPLMSIEPHELERYARSEENIFTAAAARRREGDVEDVDALAGRRREPSAEGAKPAARRRRERPVEEGSERQERRGRRLVPLLLTAAVIAVVGLVLGALSGGGGEPTKTSVRDGSQVAERSSSERGAEDERRDDAARERAAREARREQAERRARRQRQARRAARIRRAGRAAARRRANERERANAAPVAPPQQASPAPAPSTPSTPPTPTPAPSPAPAPSAPPPSEFGLEF